MKRLSAVVGGLGVACGVAVACSAPGKGSLVLAISTDMQTPKDISVVSVFITTDSAVKFDFLGRVTPQGTVSLPSTLAIVEPDNPDAQVRIRIIALQDDKARVLRDVLTTVPHQRTALLRVPLNFLDDGSAMGMLPQQFLPGGPGGAPEGDTQFNPDTIASSCDFSAAQPQTSVAGSCAAATLPSAGLPDYADALVFGAGGSQGSPACFHVDQCLAKAAPIAAATITTAADGSCSFRLPPGETGQDWNCALATTDGTGTCFGGKCLVPLESDPGEGFSVQAGNAIVMVPGVCKKLAAGASLVVDTSSCPTKNEAAPVCQPAAGSDGGSSADAVAGSCDGDYVVTCPSGGGCNGGSTPLTVSGSTATLVVGNRMLSGAVNPSSCAVTVSHASGCDAGPTVASFDLAQGTGTIPCEAGNGGTCTTLQCTVTRGGGVDGGLSQDGGAGRDASPGDGAPAIDSGSACVPATCAKLGYNCGPASDGCGNLLQCGSCPLPQYCGGGGFNVCGGNLDGGGSCAPESCAQQMLLCGPAGDGCGNVIPSCGTCTAPQTCGGGGAPGQCGGGP